MHRFPAKLTDYFDGQIDPDLLAEVKEHLGSCHHCEVVVDTTRKTIDVYRGQEHYDFPEELSTRLRAAVMARCKACEMDAPESSSGHAAVKPAASHYKDTPSHAKVE